MSVALRIMWIFAAVAVIFVVMDYQHAQLTHPEMSAPQQAGLAAQSCLYAIAVYVLARCAHFALGPALSRSR